ncbi:MAG: uracil-DNA glycosylase [Salibacteraceae bacterium]|nr:uracil-DNA glycosylase [Salibacteraceae bacterium]
MMNHLIGEWKSFLELEIESEYFQQLEVAVKKEYHGKCIYPPQEDVFNAFNYCSLDQLKVVLIGQDPYHGKGQANGLCFSVKSDQKFPPSLKNIFKELKADLTIEPENGDLSHWAKQGMLMLNTVLTVREGQANSHAGIGWEKFTRAVIKKIAEEKNGVVFMLWGGQAQKFEKLIDSNKHCILKSGHPSPLSANRGFWFGNNHFSHTNIYLKSAGKLEIAW